jgi:hypothetical protein
MAAEYPAALARLRRRLGGGNSSDVRDQLAGLTGLTPHIDAALPAPRVEQLVERDPAVTELVESCRVMERTLALLDRCAPSSAARNVHDEPRWATGPVLMTFGRTVAEAIRHCATIAIFVDSTISPETREVVGRLLAAAPSPAWAEAARSEWHAERRYGALCEAALDAGQPEPLLRLGRQVVGRKKAAMTLPTLQRDQWIWQRARGRLASNARRQVRPAMPRRAPQGYESGASSTGTTEELLTTPKDYAELMQLLGEATDEVLPTLHPDDRDRIQAAFRGALERERG